MRTGFGTDLLGQHGRFQLQEFAIRKPLAPALEILRSATSVNARLLGKEGELGAIAPGARADLIVVDGDPLRDVSVLTDVEPHSARVAGRPDAEGFVTELARLAIKYPGRGRERAVTRVNASLHPALRITAAPRAGFKL